MDVQNALAVLLNMQPTGMNSSQQRCESGPVMGHFTNEGAEAWSARQVGRGHKAASGKAEIPPPATLSPEGMCCMVPLSKGGPWTSSMGSPCLYPRSRMGPRNLHFSKSPENCVAHLSLRTTAVGYLLCAGHSALHILYHLILINALTSRRYFHFSNEEMES